MGRKISGGGALERARIAIRAAASADELRAAQAVLLPLEFGLSLAHTALILGRSLSWVSRARRQFIATGMSTLPAGRGGRRHGLLAPEDEEFLVKQAVVKSNGFKSKGVHGELQKLLEARGLAPAPSTVTAIMQRVTSRILPGKKASYLNENCGPLSHLWSREVHRRMRNG